MRPCGEGETCDAVVSLTSYGPRIRTCHIAIRSILSQSVVPKTIILWLDAKSDDVELPAELEELRGYGLQINYGCDNLYGHKKYYYAMKQYPDDCIVTIDDDVIYAKDMLATLWCIHTKYPEAVVARRAHKIMVKDNRVMPYIKWIHEYRGKTNEPLNSLMATGVGGVLYPAHFANGLLLDKDKIIKYSLRADDIWLKAYEAHEGIKTVVCPGEKHPFQIPGTLTDGLSSEPTEFGKNNDEVLHQLMKEFGLGAQSFSDVKG